MDRGLVGWWIWLFIHIAFLTGYRNRLGALLTWWLAFTLGEPLGLVATLRAGHPGHGQQLFFGRKQASLLVTSLLPCLT